MIGSKWRDAVIGVSSASAWTGVVGIGLGWCAERLALMASGNLLPLIAATLGVTAATFLPFAAQAGAVLGYVTWLVGGATGRLSSRHVGWVLLLLAALGVVMVLAPSGLVLWLGAFAAAVASFGVSLLFAETSERVSSDRQRRALNNRANAILAAVYPFALAGVTWLSARLGWRAGLGVAACAAPAICGLFLLSIKSRRPAPCAPRPVSLRAALRAIAQERGGMSWTGAASVLTWIALTSFQALVARAMLADGLAADQLALVTLFAAPAVLIGFVWERAFTARHSLELIAAFAPGLLGWGTAALAALAGERYPAPLRLALWGLAVTGINLAWFTANALVLRGLAVTVDEDRPLDRGTLSIRGALQLLPGNLAGLAALLVAPIAFNHLGLVPVALAAIATLAGAMLVAHRARHTYEARHRRPTRGRHRRVAYTQ